MPENEPKTQVKFLTALVTLLILVAGAAYQFGIKEATIDQKLEAAKERERELQMDLDEARDRRQGYERQWMEQRPSSHFPVGKK